ncbi:hypothetical protein [Chryseobacterium indologenes]|uniref:Uncharacterized protein n=1 Tax=Chryseobacterium indologenes TaxID=253 RepID=A0A0N0ZS12_CHRID|nr:hypothetical protein [Chryseobacterium indologenes]KPE48948.1 hypothetical protein AOB46_22660 [Chryseobacterium indologenes]
MKKVLALLSLAACSFGYAQGGTLILNNYSKYDFYGYIMANNTSGNCYPSISSADPEMVRVPANSHMGNGNELRYDNYRDQFLNSLYPMTAWSVALASGGSSTTLRAWNNPSMAPGLVLSNNTKWATTKFVMYYPGTTDLAPDNFNGAVTLFNNCYNAPSSFSTPSGNSAEIFTVTSGTNTITYIQLF